jgi:lysine decarboxylase
MEEWASNLEHFYREAENIKGLRLMRDIKNFDKTKLNLDMSQKGFSGRQLERLLMQEHGIYPEFSSGNLVMCMTGIGNRRQDYDSLLKALKDLSKKPYNQEQISLSARFDREKIGGQVGKTCARSVIPYPPGIPLICPGETILKADVEQLIHRLEQGEKILGLTEENQIKTLEE